MARHLVGIVCLSVIVGGFSEAVQAATTLSLTNPSFQSNSVADGATSTSHAGWTQYGSTGNAVTWNPTSTSFAGADGAGDLPSTADGSQCLWVTGEPSLYQVYSYFSYIEANKVYTLTTAIGAPLDKDFGYYGLNLANANGELSANWGSVGIENKSGKFVDVSTSFHTGPGGKTDAVGSMLIVNLSGDRAAIDNVRLTVDTYVPEPGTIVLLLSGSMVGLFVVARRVWNSARYCHHVSRV